MALIRWLDRRCNRIVLGVLFRLEKKTIVITQAGTIGGYAMGSLYRELMSIFWPPSPESPLGLFVTFSASPSRTRSSGNVYTARKLAIWKEVAQVLGPLTRDIRLTKASAGFTKNQNCPACAGGLTHSIISNCA